MAYAPPSTPMPRFLSFTLAMLTLGASACYSERLAPPTFRYSCGGDGECGEGETCISGLCQVSCTLITAEEDCELGSQVSGYLACINGVCTSACDLGDDRCPSPQSCTEIPGLSEQLEAGLCIEDCTPDSCPAGEACLEGFCLQTCDPEAEESACDVGETCLEGVCVPESVVDPESGVPE